MFYKFIFFYCFFIGNLNTAAYTAKPLHMVIYNVGQGNCVYVNCPQGNSLLIDCGSSEHNDNNRPGFLGGPPWIDFEQIKENIIKTAKRKHITIIISHLDKDHYNWLPEIFDEEKDQNNIEKIIIIGHEAFINENEHRDGPRGDLAKWLIHLRTKGIPIVFYDNYNPNLHAELPDCGVGSNLRPISLTANVCNRRPLLVSKTSCSSNKRANANSLVLKLNHGTCSAILPGDALGITTDDIINSIPPPNYNATILLTSHHGSESHGSNSEEWIRSVDPKVAVFSAGKYPRYNHPSSAVIGRLSNAAVAPRLLDAVYPHNLSYYVGDHFNMTPIPGGTTQGILSTFNAGDIHIRFQAEQFTIGDAIHPHLVPFAPCVS